MKTIKIFIVLSAIVAISLVAIGVAYGHYVTSQANIYSNTPYSTTSTSVDFWTWFRGCLGFGPNSYNYRYQAPTGENTEPPSTYVPLSPFAPQSPNQNYYPFRSGQRGYGCWGW
ncbi:MAG: hypothetical protein NWF10_00145 [Candidatus Bathyarchaeota archaeon]|jgi:hypothetical protein|nr:hypothetical protein [Candidatus Bathyarchaeota archaeon]